MLDIQTVFLIYHRILSAEFCPVSAAPPSRALAVTVPGAGLAQQKNTADLILEQTLPSALVNHTFQACLCFIYGVESGSSASLLAED